MCDGRADRIRTCDPWTPATCSSQSTTYGRTSQCFRQPVDGMPIAELVAIRPGECRRVGNALTENRAGSGGFQTSRPDATGMLLIDCEDPVFLDLLPASVTEGSQVLREPSVLGGVTVAKDLQDQNWGAPLDCFKRSLQRRDLVPFDV